MSFACFISWLSGGSGICSFNSWFPISFFLSAYQGIFFSSHSLVNNTLDIINLKLISGEEIVDMMEQLVVRAAFL